MEQIFERDLPLSDVVCGMPVLDVSRKSFIPGVALAIARPDMQLVIELDDEGPEWLEASMIALGVGNVVIGKKSSVRYDEIICRDERNPREIWRRSKQRLEQGGRCYVARRKVEEMGQMEGLFQTFPLGAKCHILHFIAMPEKPGVRQILEAGALLLDRIEAEMKVDGIWTEVAPPAMEIASLRRLNSYENAPVFGKWLQFVFLASAREAVELDEWPRHCAVSELLESQHDPHANVPAGWQLLQHLKAYELLWEQRRDPAAQQTGVQAVSAGGRLLTKSRGVEEGWFAVDVTPYDPEYFRAVVAELGWDPELKNFGEDRVRALMNYRGSCCFEAESQKTRDNILRALTGARC